MSDENLDKNEEDAIEEANKQQKKEIKLLESWGLSYNFPDPFLQKDLAKYQTRLRKLGSSNEMAISVYKGKLLQVAFDLKWLEGKPIESIGEMTPGQVSLISGVIFYSITEASRIPNV